MKDIFQNIEFEVVSKSIQANSIRICQLLERERIQHKFEEKGWYAPNKDNVELRQRMKLLRKDTLLLERLITE